MIKILNRLTWVVSLAMGFVLVILISIAFDLIDDFYAFNDDTIFIWIIATIVVGIVFKKIFLSKDFITLNLVIKSELKEEVKVKKDGIIKFLNRLTWVVSLVMGFVLAMLIGIAFDLLDNRYAFNYDTIFVWIMVTIVIGIIFKKLFLSKSFITLNLGVKLESKEEIKIEKEDLISHGFESQEVEKEKLDVGTKIANKINIDDYNNKSIISRFFGISYNSAKFFLEERLSILKHTEQQAVEERIKILGKLNFIQDFFKGNFLAKIGSIFLFLAVLFFLQLIYTIIGPIGKVMVGFIFGFIIFGIGLFLEKKGYYKESKILLGTAILINYLVILSGRYFIGEEMFVNQTLFNESITFFLLIINTIFAISVAMAFESRVLLIFSFVIAYINPFLIGEKISLSVYTFLAYSLSVSLGVLFISYYYKNYTKVYSQNLLNIAFLGGNILILLAPFNSISEWFLKLIALAFLSLLCIFIAFKNKYNNFLGAYFISTYVFFIILIIYGSFNLELFSGPLLMSVCLLFMFLMTLGGVLVYSFITLSSIFYILLTPLFIILGFFISGMFYFGNNIIYILISSVIFYILILFKFISRMSAKMVFFFFLIVGIFIFLISGFSIDVIGGNFMKFTLSGDLVNIQVYGIIISAFIFLFSAYYLSKRKGLEYLYSLATIFSIFILVPLIQRTGDLKTFSIISAILLVISNISLPFLNKILVQNKIYNLVLGMVFGAIFAAGELFYFWFGDINQSKITLGASFLFLAILYFFISYLMSLKLSLYENNDEQNENKTGYLNIVYVLVGISISLFSLAVAYVLSEYSEVVSAIWLFESSILFYFYFKTKEVKVYFAGFVLMVVGVIKLSFFVPLVLESHFLTIIPLLIVFISFVASLKFLDFEKNNIRQFHDILHIIGMVIIALILFRIIPNHNYGWLILSASLFSVFLSIVYSLIYSSQIKNIFIFFLGFLFLTQIKQLEMIFSYLDMKNIPYLKVIQYFTTILFSLVVIIFNYLPRKYNLQENLSKMFSIILNLIFSLYLFVITTQYVFFMFNENEFVITIYWGILSLFFLSYGIQKNIIKPRTLGLYILSLTTIKILIYDIWSGLDDAIMRVIALMLVGGVMIGISILYSKKYNGNLKGEFNFNNLK